MKTFKSVILAVKELVAPLQRLLVQHFNVLVSLHESVQPFFIDEVDISF